MRRVSIFISFKNIGLINSSRYLFILLILFISLQGCATIVKGSTQEMTFQSVPEGVTVTVSGRILGKTPFTTSINRKSDQSVTFEKEGYAPQTMQLATTLEPWFWGNIPLLYFGLFGSTTDGISGAVHAYSPTQYNVTLAPKNQAIAGLQSNPQNDAKSFIIISYKNILEELNSKEGEYLKSLYSILNVAKDMQSDAYQAIKKLSEKIKAIPEFADKVVNYDYTKKE